MPSTPRRISGTVGGVHGFIRNLAFPINDIVNEILFSSLNKIRIHRLLSNIDSNFSEVDPYILGGILDAIEILRSENFVTNEGAQNYSLAIVEWALVVKGITEIPRNLSVQPGMECALCHKTGGTYLNRAKIDSNPLTTIYMCSQCCRKNWYCGGHGVYYIGTSAPVGCPLFSRCKKKDFCKESKCVENHCYRSHKSFEVRKWKKSKKFFSKKKGEMIESDIPVGVELEAVGGRDDSSRMNTYKVDRNVGIGTDASIRGYPNPIEVQTPTASGKKLEELVKNITAAMKGDGLVTNEHCGIHIHLDVAHKFGNVHQNPIFYKNLFAAYVYFEMGFFALVPRERIGNRFAAPLFPEYGKFIYTATGRSSLTRKMFSKIWYQNEDLEEIKRFKKEISLREGERCSGSHHHRTKYLWANFHSLFRNQGIEIRSLEGTLHYETILRWVSIHQRFIERVSSLGAPFVFSHRRRPNDAQALKELIEFISPDKEMKKWIDDRLKFCGATKIGMDPNQIWQYPLVPMRRSPRVQHHNNPDPISPTNPSHSTMMSRNLEYGRRVTSVIPTGALSPGAIQRYNWIALD